MTSPKGPSVGRTAAGGARAAKAAATRARMLAAASELFVARGYAATSMQAIAERAEVAVQTLYFTFGTKRAVLAELVAAQVAGDTASVATLERPWAARALAAEPADQLRLQVEEAASVLTRACPVLEVVRCAAASDPEIAELWRENLAQRHAVLVAFAAALAAKTRLRDDLRPVRAADIVLAVLAPECFHLLVHERGWTPDQWRDWALSTLVGQLLPGNEPRNNVD